ncbi:YceD family protein [Mammaliicoccus stepanovicii]|uniref:YlbN-like protein n=1 Tax=Mammaliicoccus stepanovicii TaxID=643214 RepID=A0A239ZMK2_9STAP|nr:YceD family protein [Mammaliicoccus stepanovicii]PNZ79223.1 DNA-binding protein [Mammaliicoccus stepanovicii]GGI41521.1 DNA-binding protein [Mammaliicoccus stepanovicii]SNV72159.1 YlbN-like protein [Mammaliicoccus stepanovicii]
MKWSITQLKKNQNEPFTFDKEIDMNYLTERVDELIDISPIKVTGDVQVRMHDIIVNLDITGVLTLPCARTLKPVELPFDTTSTEIFELDESSDREGVYDEARHKLDGGMVNLLPIIEELVILEKPMQVFSEGSEDISLAGNGWEVIGEDQVESTDNSDEESSEKKVDPRLQKLQQLFDDNK